MVFNDIITRIAFNGWALRLGEGGTVRRLGILSGISCFGQVNHILSDMNMGSKISMVLPVLSRFTLLRRCIGQRRICLCIYEGVSDFIY